MFSQISTDFYWVFLYYSIVARVLEMSCMLVMMSLWNIYTT